MKFAYLQKTSLQDFPDTLSCIIFLGGCNFRCPACYNALILDLKESLIEEQEILEFLDKRKGKLDGVVITGGEPLINLDLPEFLEKIQEKGYKIKIDTNGSNPGLLKHVIEHGLVDYIAMDIKASKEDYYKVAGVKTNLDDIEESMKILKESRELGKIDYEFRITLVPVIHGARIAEMDDKTISLIAEWISSIDFESKVYIQEFVPVEGRLVNPKLEFQKKTSEERLKQVKEIVRKKLNNVYIRA